MGQVLRALMMVVIVAGSSVQAADLQEPDKQKHAMACFSIAGATYSAARASKMNRWSAYLLSSTITMAIGYAKEVSDRHFDHGDIQADLSGTAMAAMFPLSFEF